MTIAPLTLIITEHGTRIRQQDAIETGWDTPSSVLLIQIEPQASGLDLASLEIRFHNQAASPSRIREIIDNQDLSAMTSYCIKGSALTLIEAATNYVNRLPSEDTMVIMREYAKYIEDGTILDGFIGGLAAYLTFLVLNENGAFAKQLPLQFGIPGPTRQGNLLNKNMFRYLHLPLLALSKTTRGVIRGLVIFVQSFINLWDTAFSDGPQIDPDFAAGTQLEVIAGLSQHTIQMLGDEAKQRQSVQVLRVQLQAEIDSSLARMRREIQNLLIETQESINELLNSARSHLIKSERVTEIDQNLQVDVASRIDANLISYSAESSEDASEEFNLKFLDTNLILDEHSSIFELPDTSGNLEPSPIKKQPFRPWQQRRTLIVSPDDSV